MAAQNRLIKQQYCGNKMKKTYIEILPSLVFCTFM